MMMKPANLRNGTEWNAEGIQKETSRYLSIFDLIFYDAQKCVNFCGFKKNIFKMSCFISSLAEAPRRQEEGFLF